MSKYFTNRTIGYMLILVIMTSLFTFRHMLESKNNQIGYITEANGTMAINISSVVAISLTTNSITFGSGSIDSGYNYCWIARDGNNAGYQDFFDNYSQESTINCTSNSAFNASGSIVIENLGNVNGNITIKSSKNASSFIGGTSPEFRFGFDEDYINNCNSFYANSLGNITQITQLSNLTTTPARFCEKLNYSDGSDIASLQIAIKVPSDAAGYKQNTITFTVAQN